MKISLFKPLSFFLTFILLSTSELVAQTVKPDMVGVSINNSFAQEFLPKWQRARDYTIKVAELMPEEHYDFKVTEDIFSFREQLQHITRNFSSLQYYITGERKNPLADTNFENMSKKEIIKSLKNGFSFIEGLLNKTNDADASQEVNFFARDVYMTKKGVFELLRNHVTHHRGQAIIYLRLQGIKPPRYVGW
ncbi:DinB family protein [Fulvivirgaceae bacterium BMA10]|uniref:DinB family protein n=1 Tax=Splendidivirga corallicola TaxID=3051826 RepID=A0ABT8KVQ6_9BACT|nr:DinB family protein [Fulvivirgaceae bacterium BMA10]